MTRKGAIVVLTLLALAMLVLGVISFQRPLENSLSVRAGLVRIEMVDGRCRLRYVRLVSPTTQLRSTRLAWASFAFRWERPYPGPATDPIERLMAQASVNMLGRYSPNSFLRTTSTFEVLCLTTPFWFPVILLSIYPSVAFFRGPLRRWYRRGRGSCPNCGYILTGNVSGVCPECGVAA